ncbi:MAG: DUF58 domain-containing protein [Longimicrobiales bacterium]
MATNETVSPHADRRADLLDPATLAQLGGINIIARQVVKGFLLGLHRSPNRGFSAEFAELRSYRPGDDLRSIDWRMFARSDRFYVKQYEEETNLRAYMLLDISESMNWSSTPALPTKLWYAKHLAAALSLILIRQGDIVGFMAFHEEITKQVRARGGKLHWRLMLKHLDALKSSGATNAGSAIRNVAARLQRKGLVLFISDLLVEPEETAKALIYLKQTGHEVLVFHLIDPGERDLPTTGETNFIDTETGESLQVSVADMRREYREAVENAVAEWTTKLSRQGIAYSSIGTDEPLSRALRLFLWKRERLP